MTNNPIDCVTACRKATLLACAEQCEEASGPDRELMYAAFDACLSRTAPSRPGTVTWTREWLRFQKLVNAEAWIDTAKMLIPAGHTFGLYPGGENLRLAQVWHVGRSYCGFGIDIPEARSPHDALALTASSLRAIAAAL